MTKHYQDSNNEEHNKTDIYQICFYVPVVNCEVVKQAMFDAGAGRVDNYTDCAWQTLGQGQYRPINGSQPYLGDIDNLEKVKEYKVEMVCTSQHIEKVVQALKSSHPYEVPAFSVIQLQTF